MDNTDTLATKQTNKQKLKIPLIKTHKKQDEQHGPHQKQGSISSAREAKAMLASYKIYFE